MSEERIRALRAHDPLFSPGRAHLTAVSRETRANDGCASAVCVWFRIYEMTLDSYHVTRHARTTLDAGGGSRRRRECSSRNEESHDRYCCYR